MKRRADRLFSEKIRSRSVCELAGTVIKCGGPLQCAHILSRRYHAIRWDEQNALCLCRDHHVYFTHRPFEWMRLMDQRSPGLMDELWAKTREPWDKNLAAVVEALR